MNVFDTCIHTAVRAAGALALVAAGNSPEPILAALFGLVGAAAMIRPQWLLPQEAPAAVETPVGPVPAPEPAPPQTGWTVVRPYSQPWSAPPSRPTGSPTVSGSTLGDGGRRDGPGFGPTLSAPPHRRRAALR